LIAVGAIYLTMNLAIIGVVPWRDFVPAAGQPLADPPPPIASMFIERLYGAKIANVFTVIGALDGLRLLLCVDARISRIPFAAARDGNFFSIFGRVHPTKQFTISLLLSAQCQLSDAASADDGDRRLCSGSNRVQFIAQIARCSGCVRSARFAKAVPGLVVSFAVARCFMWVLSFWAPWTADVAL